MDWSVRRLGPQPSSLLASSSSGIGENDVAMVVSRRAPPQRLSRRQSNVLENRDLCRIISSFIRPNKKHFQFNESEDTYVDEENENESDWEDNDFENVENDEVNDGHNDDENAV